ncbi:sugar kinase [Pelagibius marinus]|uniref:sugar kinase n=1 Tax=Pelagibius marinus TaxID=2762760 RepID=UPI00187316AE|nr:sugar kinase [Pelagibius marinus]
MLRVASIGECMIELSETAGGGGDMHRTFGGDTLNTAVYLARTLHETAPGTPAEVHYVTALGDDPFSDEMLAAWQAEGLKTDQVFRLPGRLPGLYIIRTDTRGERSFHYWRNAAAAREICRPEQAEVLTTALAGFDLVYLSGITLGILDAESRQRLYGLLATLKQGGCRIAFDTNYRPRLWESREEAQEAVTQVLGLAALALPTFEDDAALFGDASPEATIERLFSLGVEEVVVKCGAEPCVIARRRGITRVEGERVEKPVDTTAAGDSFNGAYLAARLAGAEPEDAAAAGHRLAARVIATKGAIIPA